MGNAHISDVGEVSSRYSMKKLFYIAHARIPTEKAHGIQIIKTCDALAGKGYEVTLILPRKRGGLLADPFSFYGVDRNFKIVRVRSLDLLRLGWLGFWIGSVTFAFTSAWYVIGKQGVCYTRDEFTAFFLRIIGRNVLWEGHMGQRNIFVRALVAFQVPFVVISEGLKHLYLAMGVDERKILVAPDAVEVGQFDLKKTKEEARKELGIQTDKPIVLYTGSMQKWKGVTTLVAAAEGLTEVEVMLVSGKAHQEIPLYLQAADILVIPNGAAEDISRLYTSPMKLFEYMASRRPIVASDLPSLREVIDEECVYFFAPDDPVSLRTAILRALKNPEESQAKAAVAFTKVQRHTWSDRAENIIQFFEQKRLIQNILLVQSGKLGDMVCTTPVFRAIKHAYPVATLSVAGFASNRAVLEGNVYVDEYLDLDEISVRKLKGMNLDTAILLNPNREVLAKLLLARIRNVITPRIEGGFSPFATKLYRLLALFATETVHRFNHYAPREYLRALEPLGIFERDVSKELFFTKEAEKTIGKFFVEMGLGTEKKIVGFIPSAGNKIKEWGAENFAALIDRISQVYDVSIVLLGGPADKELVEKTWDLIKNKKRVINPEIIFTVDELKALVSRLSLLIGVDTGPIYIAEAFGVPTVDIVGPMNEFEQPPMGDKHKSVYIKDRAGSAIHIMNARIYNVLEARRQVEEITPEMVFKVVETILS